MLIIFLVRPIFVVVVNWSKICVECPNNEVVEFQPQTGDTPGLESVDLVNLII